MSDYRIRFKHGRYELMQPCIIGTGVGKSSEYPSGWEVVDTAPFVWQLRVIQLGRMLSNWWHHRADGYDTLREDD